MERRGQDVDESLSECRSQDVLLMREARDILGGDYCGKIHIKFTCTF